MWWFPFVFHIYITCCKYFIVGSISNVRHVFLAMTNNHLLLTVTNCWRIFYMCNVHMGLPVVLTYMKRLGLPSFRLRYSHLLCPTHSIDHRLVSKQLLCVCWKYCVCVYVIYIKCVHFWHTFSKCPYITV